MQEPLLVFFEREDGRLYGEILVDLQDRDKPVYLKHGSRQTPRPGELWRCRILHEELQHHPRDGKLIVAISQRYDASLAKDLAKLKRLRSADGREVRLGPNVKRILLHFPGYARPIADSLARCHIDDMPMNRFALTMNLGYPVGRPTVIQARFVGDEESATFARWKDTSRIVRVTNVDTSVWSSNPCATFRLVRHDAPPDVLLQDFALGRHNWGSPQQMLDRDHRERALRFWREHAYVFDPGVFDPPFQSTWQNILNDRRPRARQRSGTRLKISLEDRPRSSPPPLEGPLILPDDETG